MTVVDPQYAAEVVTDKGRVYVFDAAECMINYLKDRDLPTENYAYLLVADYEQPGNLIPAQQSSYLISEQLPSPMGAFLTAFSSTASSHAMQQSKGGEIFTWESVQKKW